MIDSNRGKGNLKCIDNQDPSPSILKEPIDNFSKWSQRNGKLVRMKDRSHIHNTLEGITR